MVDPYQLVGRRLPRFRAAAERGQLRLFAGVLGETDAVYTDLDTARAAGYPDLPIPPTFLFSLELERPDPHGVLRELGIDQRQLLHGEQEFRYHRMAFAGQELEFRPQLSDYYEKKDGALKFLVRRTEVLRGEEPIAELANVLVIRQLEAVA